MTKTRKDHRRAELAQKLDILAVFGLLPALLKLLPDERQRTLLLLRHGRGLSWPELRAEAARRGLYYSERQLYRIYEQALGCFEALTETAHEN